MSLDVLISILGSQFIATMGAWFTIVGFLLYFFFTPIVYFINKDDTSGINPNQKFHFITEPAKVTQAFYNKIWGEVGKGIFGVLTWRSFFATLAFSVLINLICIQLILVNAPPDAPEFEIRLIKILYASEVWFIFCNFIGDLFSINVTRLLLDRIINKKGNWRYILIDIGGIFCGYILMLLPSLLVFQFGLSFFDSPNEIIQAGLFGNLLMPFFLFIFALSYFPSLISFFALFAILSITVPTGIYLTLIIFINIGYRIYQRYLLEKIGLVIKYSKLITHLGAFLSMLGTALLSLPIIFEMI